MLFHFCLCLGNEWKTRFENQEEINRHLARQILLMEKNIDQSKEEHKTSKERMATLNLPTSVLFVKQKHVPPRQIPAR